MPKRPTIVLIHGLLGFDRCAGMAYFRGVRALLEDMGLRVLTPRLPWGGSIRRRARALARAISPEPGPLHLVGHSMGGLDARAYIAHHGGHHHVASLTTLATPHHGSAAADRVLQDLSPWGLLPGVRDLTRAQMRQFNADTPDHPDVCYRSYSAARPVDQIPLIVRHHARTLQQEEGANDGQVSVESAQWGDHIATLSADHFELIGLQLGMASPGRPPFDHLALYREIGNWVLAQETPETAPATCDDRASDSEHTASAAPDDESAASD